ncbi:class I SAM-dependent methyltransferase [Sulfuracidifex tepidarius]|uniref:Ubiquinone/menaquinone biosynthesis C-methyltransferase UbiE n=1 Tax=Sulfuracidifex tepidarius TaxID=1294262 RepID=A0A510DUV6_9CREN|nr:class I SAM-dependent methyltransferase [Sulfuracidifex tepidarius]BBG23975.1 Ubiquinone/menaquinone biosynthesis C-methyltransferase UbiE [Sulfuracidifex tepidarius]BBG26730.1 Ubiquinone/menaquinone biosynthesis C-methyltransferase UbiE [Sulfuracidifex tepidarius]
MSSEFFKETHPELKRLGIEIPEMEKRYPTLMRMGISHDDMIYLARRISPLLQGSRDILDIGCGNCLIATLIAKLISSKIFVIDEWKEMSVDTAKRNASIDKVELEIGEMKQDQGLPYKDNHFDAVYSVMFLFNVPKERRDLLLEETRRVLTQDGKFVVVDNFIFRGKMKRELTSHGFQQLWYGEENAFSFFLLKNVKST